ncbi:MAG TPA: hypothetical protein PKA41_06095 [Verrucomicrobiota bacterium]|nr:hypothetical protein [Verrucomicrobiota bacterium]
MKNKRSAIVFTLGLVLGLTVAFCLGAGESSSPASKPKPNKPDFSRLQFWGYPNSTGIFDPDTGTIYVYDNELRNCFIVRQINTLGNRLQ